MLTNWIGKEEVAMTNSKKPVGWRKESGRHALAAKGVKTGRKKATWPPHCAECVPVTRFTRNEQDLLTSLYDDAVGFYVED